MHHDDPGAPLPRPAAGVALPREPKQERSQRKQERLVDAAEQLFAERGFDGVTGDDIAAAAGYASATFYNYFSDKTQVFILVADRHMAAVVPVLEPVVDALRRFGGAHEAVRASLHQLLDNRRDLPWLRATWRRLVVTAPEVRDYQRTVNRVWERDLARFITRGIEAGALRAVDPAAMAATVRILVDSVVDEIVLDDAVDADATLDALSALIVRALVAPA